MTAWYLTQGCNPAMRFSHGCTVHGCWHGPNYLQQNKDWWLQGDWNFRLWKHPCILLTKQPLQRPWHNRKKKNLSNIKQCLLLNMFHEDSVIPPVRKHVLFSTTSNRKRSQENVYKASIFASLFGLEKGPLDWCLPRKKDFQKALSTKYDPCMDRCPSLRSTYLLCSLKLRTLKWTTWLTALLGYFPQHIHCNSVGNLPLRRQESIIFVIYLHLKHTQSTARGQCPPINTTICFHSFSLVNTCN